MAKYATLTSPTPTHSIGQNPKKKLVIFFIGWDMYLMNITDKPTIVGFCHAGRPWWWWWWRWWCWQQCVDSLPTPTSTLFALNRKLHLYQFSHIVLELWVWKNYIKWSKIPSRRLLRLSRLFATFATISLCGKNYSPSSWGLVLGKLSN